MRKITTDELQILSESYGQVNGDIYVAEDFSEYCALSDHHRQVLHAKETAYRILGVISEAGPVGYNVDGSSPTVQPWDRPETSREKSFDRRP